MTRLSSALALLIPLAVPVMAWAAPSQPSAAAGPPAAAAEDPATAAARGAIEALFGRVRAALAAGRGSAVLPELSSDSRARLQAMLETARAGDRASLQDLDATGKFAALGLRRHLSAADLRRMSLGDVADHALKAGWLGPNIIRQATLGPLRVRGDRATALLLVNHKPALVSADFVREGDAWRVDLTTLYGVAGQLLQSFAAFAGQSDEAYITALLDRLSPAARR